MTKKNKALITETPLPISTKTKWGEIKAVHSCAGERHYFMIDRHGSMSLMPAEVVEAAAEGGKQ